jgi:hypothetical protein
VTPHDEYGMRASVDHRFTEMIKAEEHRQLVDEIEKQQQGRDEQQKKLLEKVLEELQMLPGRVHDAGPGGGVVALREFVEARFQEMSKLISDMRVERAAAAQPEMQRAIVTAPQVDLHTWGGRLHPVPATFELKLDTVKCYWDCYFWGDGSSVAYRNLHGYDLNRLGASNLSRANKTVKFLLEVGEKPPNFQPVDLQTRQR